MVSLISAADKFISGGLNVRPRWLWKWLFSVLFSLYTSINRLKVIASQMRLPVTVVSGVGKDAGEDICFLFIGRETFPLYLNDLLFNRPPQVKQVGTVFIWRLKDLDRFVSSDVDAVLVSCDRFYQRWLQKADLFVFPHVVDMVLDVSGSFDDFYKKMTNSAKADIKKAEKQRYTYEIVSDLDHLRFFYERMYLPLIRTRYPDTPMYIPQFLFFKWLHMIGYRLLFVKDNQGKYVSGCYFHQQGKVGSLRYNGVLDGDFELIRNGAESAIYCFFIVHAQEQKVSILDFGGVRPFFHDGLFFYKRKWGMTVEHSDLIEEIFGLRILSECAPLKQFLLENPFIGLNDKNELVGFVFVDKNSFTDALCVQFEKRFQTPGVNEVRFIKL